MLRCFQGNLLGTNNMFLLGKGLHWSSKLSLKWNTDQSPVTHTWVKGDAPLEEPLLLCTWMGDSFILEPWLTVQETCIRKGDSWFFRPEAQEWFLPKRPSKPHLGTCWKGGNSGFSCHLHAQSTKVPNTNFSGFPCLSPHATKHPNEKFNWAKQHHFPTAHWDVKTTGKFETSSLFNLNILIKGRGDWGK